MTAPNWTDIVQAIVAVLALGIGLSVIYSLRHARSANFVAAWLSISEHLQGREVMAGRLMLRSMKDRGLRSSPPDDAEVLETWASCVKAHASSEALKMLNAEVKKLRKDSARAQRLRESMWEAVGAFDLVGILAVQSEIPGLLDVVAREWNDSIIPAFRNGSWIIGRRFAKKRVEKMEHFAVLYARAIRIRQCPYWRDYPVPRSALAIVLDESWPSIEETASVAMRELAAIGELYPPADG